MPDSPAKKAWMKENSKMYSLKIMKRTESDILEFLEQQERPVSTIKVAIREYIQNHKEMQKEQG